MKIQKKSFLGGGGLVGGGGSGWGGGGQVGCERRIDVFVKIKKKMVGEGSGGGRVGLGVRVDVNEELNLL